MEIANFMQSKNIVRQVLRLQHSDMLGRVQDESDVKIKKKTLTNSDKQEESGAS